MFGVEWKIDALSENFDRTIEPTGLALIEVRICPLLSRDTGGIDMCMYDERVAQIGTWPPQKEENAGSFFIRVSFRYG